MSSKLLHHKLSFNGFGQEASKNAPYFIVSLSKDKPPPPRSTATTTTATTTTINNHNHKRDTGGEAEATASSEAIKTAARSAWRHMYEVLGGKLPKLIISVTGGAKRFEMNKKHLKSFKTGLMKAATTSEAWIITGGTKNGVMEFVGDAVKEYMLENGAYEQGLVVIGVATLGAVVHCEDLVKEAKPHFYLDNTTAYKYKFPEQSGVKQALLDPHHTHFILVDDGTRGSFGKEIEFRAAFEQHDFSTADHHKSTNGNTHNTMDTVSQVPVVMMVLEGGINSLETAVEAIKKKTPVIVLEGSGRAADFVVRAQDCMARLRNDEAAMNEELMKESLFFFTEERMAEKAVHFAKILLDPFRKHLLTVFYQNDDTSGDDLAEVILNALLRVSLHSSENSNTATQTTGRFLDLALSFNRCDIAKKEILKYEKKTGLLKPSHLNDHFVSALKQNKPEFIHLFLELGVEVGSFFTYKMLVDLYKYVFEISKDRSPTASVFKCLYNDINQDKPLELVALGKSINHLTDNQFEGLYKDVKNLDANLEKPNRDIFFWCILFSYHEMARIFWRAGTNYIGGALTASRIMTSLSELALLRHEEFELSRHLKTEADKYEVDAKGILDECYTYDSNISKNLMVRSLSTWGDWTLFDLANAGKMMSFAEHDCCQAKLNTVWCGRLRSYTSSWTIFISLLFPFIMVNFIQFRDSSEVSNQIKPTDDNDDNDLHQRSSSLSSTISSSSSSSLSSMAKRKMSTLFLMKRGSGDSGGGGGGGCCGGEGGCGGCCGGGGSSGCCGCCYSYFDKLYSFFNAPIVKFGYFTIAYLIFLSIFSYFVLVDLKYGTINGIEILTWVWMFSMGADEIRQMIVQDAPTLLTKISKYYKDKWNLYEQLLFIMMLVAVILRFTLSPSNFDALRIVYALTLMLSILKLLKHFYVHQYIGPKVIMIQNVLFDLMFFVIIFGVFLLAYGITTQALIYPNNPPTWNILYKILYQPYFTLFGQFNVPELMGQVSNCVTNQTLYLSDPMNYPLCSQYSWVAVTLFSIYAIIVMVMLVNLLVAIFSFTFNSIQESALQTWQFYRIDTISEFFEKPALVPPLIIISHVILVCQVMCGYCCGERGEDGKRRMKPVRNDLRMELDDNESKRLGAFEKKGMENYFIGMKDAMKNDSNFKIDAIQKRVDKMRIDVESIRDSLDNKTKKWKQGEDAAAAATTAAAAAGKLCNHLKPCRYKILEDKVKELDGRMMEQSRTFENLATKLDQYFKDNKNKTNNNNNNNNSNNNNDNSNNNKYSSNSSSTSSGSIGNTGRKGSKN